MIGHRQDTPQYATYVFPNRLVHCRLWITWRQARAKCGKTGSQASTAPVSPADCFKLYAGDDYRAVRACHVQPLIISPLWQQYEAHLTFVFLFTFLLINLALIKCKQVTMELGNTPSVLEKIVSSRYRYIYALKYCI
jgi:hypothetical protein